MRSCVGCRYSKRKLALLAVKRSRTTSRRPVFVRLAQASADSLEAEALRLGMPLATLCASVLHQHATALSPTPQEATA